MTADTFSTSEYPHCILSITQSQDNAKIEVFQLPTFSEMVDPLSQLLLHETLLPIAGNIVKMEAFHIGEHVFTAVAVATRGGEMHDPNKIYDEAYYAHERNGRRSVME